MEILASVQNQFTQQEETKTDISQTLLPYQILDKTYQRPAHNKNHLRLYGHHLCPFVEKARLALNAKNLRYQDVQVNLERRTKWHYLLNDGFLPFLETPRGQTILESKIIMEYLENAYKREGVKLYLDTPEEIAQQHMIMKMFDDVASVLFEVIMSHGQSKTAIEKLHKYFTKLENLLKYSQTGFFMNQQKYTMIDIYGLPHTSRVFYLQGSALNIVYENNQFEQKYPLLKQWVFKMRSQPELKEETGGVIIIKAFHNWIEELVTMPVGTKPPLRIPMKL